MLVRIAHSLKELDLLPRDLVVMPSIRSIKVSYQDSFMDILRHENAEVSNSALSEYVCIIKK